MTVQVQETPNPNARKYILPGRQFAQPLNVSSGEAAAAHPLTARLFALEPVYNVFLVRDFVTVNKLPDADWTALEPQIIAILEAFNES